jgi:gas vesicle protein
MTDHGFDKHQGGGGFVIGLLTGTVLGAGLGILFAPKAGSELRNTLSERAGGVANKAQEGYRKAAESAGQWAEKGKEVAGDWAERGKEVYDKAREVVSRGAAEAQTYVDDAAGAVSRVSSETAGRTEAASRPSYSGSPTSYSDSTGPGTGTSPAGSRSRRT